MSDNPPPKKSWVLTKESFDNLLLHLDSERDKAGEKYKVLWGKLLNYFEWQNNDDPQALADETINRVARRLMEGEEIIDINSYCRGVARRVASENRKAREREHSAVAEYALLARPQEDAGISSLSECYEKCLRKLTVKEHDLIVKYYTVDEHSMVGARKLLAVEMSVPLNALRIRVFRIRGKLEECVNNCLKRLERR